MVTVQAVNEEELIAGAQRGDRNAFSELVRVHAQGVIKVVYRMCGDALVAEDAAQETFLRAWQNLPSYSPGTSLRNWLYRIAFNAGMDLVRRERRIMSENIEDLSLNDPRPGPESQASERERKSLVQQAVLSLPDASRAVLILREYEDLSYQEIAESLDIPIGTVMSRLSYARRLLKEKLEPELVVQTEAEYV